VLGQPAKRIAPGSGNFHPVLVIPPTSREFADRHAQILVRSYKHFTGRELLPLHLSPGELAERLFDSPFVLVSHGTEADPVLNYGNRAALTLWEMSWDELTHLPSRLTAEAPERQERARLLAAVAERGFIDDYSGVRCSRTGKRFKIARATIWNLILPDGAFYGQAAMFDHWERI
jgi:hypothetical protein